MNAEATSVADIQITLLGPQSNGELMGRVLEGNTDRLATISAGWQEREADADELAVMGLPADVDLELYHRSDAVMAADPDYRKAHRSLQRSLRELRRMYNVRLDHAMASWSTLMDWPVNEDLADPHLARPEQERAMAAVRAVDREHADRVQELRDEFEAAMGLAEREHVRRQRDELAERMNGVDTVVVTGGHVVVLLNRMRLFDVPALLAGKSVVACSAGAMALAPTVVLFHDTPPWGPGHAEVLEHGMGLFDGVIPLPDGSRRLALSDARRVARLAQRFEPTPCLVLDSNSQARFTRGHWESPDGVLRLTTEGTSEEIRQW